MKGYVWKAVFLLLFGIAGCSSEEPAVRVDLDKRESVHTPDAVSVITYAYLPQYSHTLSYRRHYRMVEYLRTETGLNIKQIFPDTFDKHIKMVGQGKIDISFSNPLVYVKISHRYGARAFARIVETNGKEYFRGQIICRADDRFINVVEDCRGKRLIAVDPTSAGGYLYPLGHLIQNGIQKSNLKVIDFASGPGGMQEKVVLAVYAGKYDIGMIREGTLNVVMDKIDINEIRVVANTRWYPGWLYAARSDLDKEIVTKIRDAMMKLDYKRKSHRPILEAANITRIIPSEDHEFDPVRELAGIVGIRLDE